MCVVMLMGMGFGVGEIRCNRRERRKLVGGRWKDGAKNNDKQRARDEKNKKNKIKTQENAILYVQYRSSFIASY